MYFQIAVDLRRRIAEGDWTAGERIAGELSLAQEYDVSRVTLRQALAELVKDDLLERRRGSGTFVRERHRPLVYDLDFTTGVLTSKLRAQGFVLRGELLDAGVVEAPGADLCRRLALAPGEAAEFVVRRIIIDEEPAAIYRSWFRSALVPDIHRSQRHHESLAIVLAEDYGLVPARSENEIEVVRGIREEVALLDAPADVPLVVVTGSTFLEDESPLEFFRMAWLGDRVRFHVNGTNEPPPDGLPA
jgi:DNA-binding GntR family transcriptional regulator